MIAGGETISFTEQRVLDALYTRGPTHARHSIDPLEMSWAQAFLVVDRLSRSRHVALHRTDSREYLISINAAMHTDVAGSEAGL
jgi:hypothetical protein